MINRNGLEPLRGPRFSTEWVDGADWIVTRAQRSWFVIPFISIWLVMWTIGGIAAINSLFTDEFQAFILIWLVGWAFGWAFAFSWISWQLGGKSMVSVQAGVLEYRWSMPLLSKARRFDISQVQELRVASSSYPYAFMQASYPPFLPIQRGGVRFDYGARTVTILSGLDEAEYAMIINWLKDRIPNRFR